ncbi:MAG: glycosyltransferase involved in cell wall biosynthesis [Planctomycetota bacterium]|jgi:glycosyltransferase involved in cell wall biosynthesis
MHWVAHDAVAFPCSHRANIIERGLSRDKVDPWDPVDKYPGIMEVVFFEPWYGGSHRAFLDAWTRHSRHRITVHGLPARHWKWRQEASAWELARRALGQPAPDVIACSDFMDLPRLLGFLPEAWRSAPTLAYFHENQLTYDSGAREAPAPTAGTLSEYADFTHGFSNVLTAVRADGVVFNSEFHRSEFADAGAEFLRILPKPNPRNALLAAVKAAHVVAPLPELEEVPLGTGAPPGSPLRVVFPHRLEPDKDPRAFLDAVASASERVALEIVLLGGRLEQSASSTQLAAQLVEGITVHAGYCTDREEYLAHLGAADVVTSTAQHEFFGIAFAEAMAAGCAPLAPDRLNYPALTAGSPSGAGALFQETSDLVERLVAWAQPEAKATLRAPAQRAAQRACVLSLDAGAECRRLDAVIDELSGRNGSRDKAASGDQ